MFKKAIFFFFSAAGICLSGASFGQSNIQLVLQNGNTSVVRFEGELPQLSYSAEGAAVSYKESTPILKKGMPDLPKVTTSLIVDNEKAMELHVIHASFEDIQGITVAPSKGNLLRTVDPQTVTSTYGSVYETNAFFPESIATLTEPFVQGHFRGQNIQFFPVQYNPVTQTLRVYHHIEVAVNATPQLGQNPLPAHIPISCNALQQEVYRDHFINYPFFNDRYEQIGELGNMLVITTSDYLDVLEPWITWKKEKGIPVRLADVEDIGGIQEIADYVAQEYQENGLTYLVLVGNENQVPTELVNNSGGSGFCDPCYGYISGNDSYAEVFVGRLLVHTPEELGPVIQKILEYEKNPNTSSDWFSVAMGIGSSEGEGAGDDDQIDYEHQNAIKEDLLSYTFTAVWEKYEGSQAAASPTGGATADAGGDPSPASLSTVINSGCSLINYTGHGNHSIISTGNFTNSNIHELVNHGKYPYFIIVGCCVGDFDDDAGTGDTFGEAWLKSENTIEPTGGIGGAFSTVFQTWAPPMEGQDEMNKLIAEMGQVSTRHTLGSIHVHGCASMNDAYGVAGTDMTDTWILMGDPSVQLRTAMPTPITTSLPSSLFFGVTSLDVLCSVENALVALTIDGEILASGLVSNGSCSLAFDAIVQPVDLLVTITHFNTIPFQGTIPVLPAEGPYVIEDAYSINDEQGNNNGLADYNESILVDVTIENIGVEEATEVSVQVNTTDSNVTLTDNQELAGTLAPGASLVLSDAFSFTVAGAITDQHPVLFTVTCTDASGQSWNSTFTVVLNAPVLECDLVSIDDSAGNNNGRLDAGESANLIFTFKNTGHAATGDVSASASENSSFVTIENNTASLPALLPNATAEAVFSLSVAPNVPMNEPVVFETAASFFSYNTTCELERFMNQIVENWESGGTSSFDWQLQESTSQWFVTDFEPAEGNYCLQSGNIEDNQQSILRLDATFSEAGDFSFNYKTSTEDGWDFLRFRVNNNTIESWSGDNDWNNFSYPVAAGTYTFRWVYFKDEIQSQGLDACWVDDLVFPPMVAVSVVEEELQPVYMEVYPNPSSDLAWVEMNVAQNQTVQFVVENQWGQLVYQSPESELNPGVHRFSLATTDWAAGMYFIRLTDGSLPTVKWMKQ